MFMFVCSFDTKWLNSVYFSICPQFYSNRYGFQIDELNGAARKNYEISVVPQVQVLVAQPAVIIIILAQLRQLVI